MGACTMSLPHEADVEEGKVYRWGTKRGVGRSNKDIQFYQSFLYNGVEYSLYDCVYVYHEYATETYIGKIVQLFETPTGEKKMRVVWFFRPIEIRNCLGDYVPRWNELFLASGQGLGVTDVNPLEAVLHKCHVVCASKDKRNCQPSEQELKLADYVFFCTFDVGKLRILKNLPDQIHKYKVEYFFNKQKEQKIISSTDGKPNVEDLSGKPKAFNKSHGPSVKVGKSCKISVAEDLAAQRHVSTECGRGPKNSILKDGVGRDKTLFGQSHEEVKAMSPKAWMNQTVSEIQPPENRTVSEVQPPKKRKLLLDEEEESNSEKPVLLQEQGGRITEKHNIDRQSWFRQLSWEERLMEAQRASTLVLLENLDPSFTSSEVKDLVLHAFNERAEAKMIQHNTFSSPSCGKAFVIFKSKEAADVAQMELSRKCLMLADGRVLVGRRGTLQDHCKHTSFTGYLSLDKLRPKGHYEEVRKAVSTSHCSQPNTIEYDMALEWCLLQERSDMWWKKLREMQQKEMDEMRSKLKVKLNS